MPTSCCGCVNPSYHGGVVRLVHPVGSVLAHQGHPVGVVVKSELYAGVSSEVLSVLPMHARVSRIVKGLCLC